MQANQSAGVTTLTLSAKMIDADSQENPEEKKRQKNPNDIKTIQSR